MQVLPDWRDALARFGRFAPSCLGYVSHVATWSESAWAVIGRLLGRSTYELPPNASNGVSLSDEQVEEVRSQYGGALHVQPITQTRWLLSQLERAQIEADAGVLLRAGSLMRTVDSDGVLAGLMSTRAGGLVRLPKKFRGPSDMVDALQSGGEFARSVFEEMFPASELERFVSDGIKLGVAIGELRPVKGRAFPVFVRLLPEFLVWRWAEQRWYYQSIAGLLPITPGDGRWILHTPGGRSVPWQSGLWRALGRAYITKDHAREHRDNWESKLANPARVTTAPVGATMEDRRSLFTRLIHWGVNTVFSLTPGWDIKLIESNGRGADSFRATIEEQDKEFQIALTGQTVMSEGGVGFQNADVFDAIKADLIQRDGDGLALTLNTQGLPAWTAFTYGEERLAESPTVQWDTTPPSDQNAVASSLVQAATAIKSLTEALALAGSPRRLDVEALATKFGIPLEVEADVVANENASLALVENVDREAQASAMSKRLRSVQARARSSDPAALRAKLVANVARLERENARLRNESEAA